ncbi:helix-turn-helix transcriptional regulator [Hymenobacter sp. GOD-10R]|uniref:helix-turn-helix domain-containing protein n=1 Tax=Hymenobacter sp. GOD-10R TaxID=3093922 RepID=UPI002D775781|nr:helix-turn-helix transcriptional regulator [Hymenobacter sp. GOD-10R]WRQ30675.1 helix-turn-helix transcriptional regulator [Hymenobacter sp. GOD-10R]
MTKPYTIHSISELHRLLEIGKPEHPLVSVIDFAEITCFSDEKLRSVVYNFYCIALKKNFQGKMQYGQNSYDFDEGIMTFFAPGQVVTTDIVDGLHLTGWWLVVHPDFIASSPLAKKMKEYDFFSYAVNEALHLSEKEEAVVDFLIQTLQQEYRAGIDSLSHTIILSHIQLLLDYCQRFYNRQFLTRQVVHHTLLEKLETLLTAYLGSEQLTEAGPPTVQYLAEQLAMSPNYLSSMLKSLTGQNAQQHIHQHLLEKAKTVLTTSELSVSEIAFLLGFNHPQSFTRLFKAKTSLSPLDYRKAFRLN